MVSLRGLEILDKEGARPPSSAELANDLEAAVLERCTGGCDEVSTPFSCSGKQIFLWELHGV